MPIHVQIAGDRGLVWDIQDILKLRKEYRLVGCMIGGISKFQSQVAVMGLPLQLSPEEVSLAAASGWVQLYGLDFSIPTAAAAAAATALPQGNSILQQQQEQASQREQQQPHAAQPQQQDDAMQCDNAEEFDEFYAAYYGLETPQQQQQPDQQQQVRTKSTHAEPPVQQQQQQQQDGQHVKRQQDTQAWQQTLKSSRFPIPMTVADAAAGFEGGASAAAAADQQQRKHTSNPHQPQQQQQQGGHAISSSGSGAQAGSSQYCQLQPVTWQYPCTALQWLRLSVFTDLHSKGFCVTGGAKFGGDYLAYPGDPHLYHAQYVIRVVLPDQVLVPSVLQGLARGVHAARKHLVLATVQPASSSAAAAAAAAVAGVGSAVGSAAATTAAAVGGLAMTNGVGADISSNSISQITVAAAAVSAAATDAAFEALFSGVVTLGPVQLGAAGGEAGAAVDGCAYGAGSGVRGVLRYITIARETGWSGE